LFRNEASLDGKKVRYYEAGDGAALILLHGAGGTARLWRRQIGVFSGKFRVLAIDLPGFGGTDEFPEIKDVKGYAVFLAAFLEDAGINRVSLVGSSMGGWAACWFALIYPEKVNKLVLVSPAGIYRSDNPPMSIQILLKEIMLWHGGSWNGHDKGENNELVRGLSSVKRLYDLGGMEPDLTGVLSMIKASTLIIWGDEDKVIPLSYSEIFRTGVINSKVKIIKGAGHLPYAEKPDVFNEILSAFLEEVT